MTNQNLQLRLRVFAGPNGSGKSTVIEAVRATKVGKAAIDFGYYINADDITQQLILKRKFDFSAFEIVIDRNRFKDIVLQSGLINQNFDKKTFLNSFSLISNVLTLKRKKDADRLAQIIADVLRKELLELRKRFSFETVFSHSSKIDIMRQAVEAGYKVYLYFVATESPDINVFRVEARARKGGHYVPPAKVISRYYRSLDLLYEAAQLGYQVYFFDNSVDGENFRMVAHFKKGKEKKEWDSINGNPLPQWFLKYYSAKISFK
ncbi:MAG: hypothetical protein QM764_22075 [Chitinophagaceae bacterium]